MVALTFVGSDTQHDRLEGKDEGRAREGWVNKSHCHSLPSCVHVCVYMWTCWVPALFPCPLRLCVGKRPSGAVMADQAWRWRPHAAVEGRLAR